MSNPYKIMILTPLSLPAMEYLLTKTKQPVRNDLAVLALRIYNL